MAGFYAARTGALEILEKIEFVERRRTTDFFGSRDVETAGTFFFL
jgi:hypothetical protein